MGSVFAETEPDHWTGLAEMQHARTLLKHRGTEGDEVASA